MILLLVLHFIDGETESQRAQGHKTDLVAPESEPLIIEMAAIFTFQPHSLIPHKIKYSPLFKVPQLENS